MAHSVEHKAPYRPSGEVRMLPPPTERICPPSHAGGGAGHRTMLLGRRIHEHRRFRSRIRPLQRRPHSASRANPSVESVRGLIGRVPGPSFSNRRPPQLAPAEMNRRMSGLVRSLSGFPPSGGTDNRGYARWRRRSRTAARSFNGSTVRKPWFWSKCLRS